MQSPESQLVGLLDEFVHRAGAIEQGKLGVQLQVDKIGVRHGDNLTRRLNESKLQSF